MLAFMTVAMVIGYGLVILRADRLEGDGEVSCLLSKESAILANSVLLLIVTATVFAGTLFPLAAEVLTDEKVSVGAPYYNKVIVPIMIGLIFLMGIGPSMPWRKVIKDKFTRKFGVKLGVALMLGIASLLLNVGDIVTFFAIVAVGFAALVTLEDIATAVRARARSMQVNLLSAAAHVFVHSRQRIGALIVHIGVITIAAGMIASGLFQSVHTVSMRIGDRIDAGGYTVTLRELADTDGANYDARTARFSVSKHGTLLDELAPEKRFYTVRNMATTEVAIRSVMRGDLYIVMGDEPGDGSVVTRIFWNPLVSWIWLGWMVLLIGALMSLSKSDRRVGAPAARTGAIVSQAPVPGE